MLRILEARKRVGGLYVKCISYKSRYPFFYGKPVGRRLRQSRQPPRSLGVSEHLSQLAEQEATNRNMIMDILGPTAAPLAKLRDKFRFHMLLRGKHREELRQVIIGFTPQVKPPAEIQWTVDMDPLDML